MQEFESKKSQWTVQQLINMQRRGELNFNNPIQRGEVWNRTMASLYIHSLFYGILLYQKPFLASRKNIPVDEENSSAGNRICWDILDGKQRGTWLLKYAANEFTLTGLQNEPLIDFNGVPYQINGKRFKQLPEQLQEEILSFAIEVVCLNNAPREKEALYFIRSNSGKSMTKIDMARALNSAIEVVAELSQHDFIKVIYSEKAIKEKKPDEFVTKTYISIKEELPDLSAKHYAEVFKNIVITEDDKAEITEIYDKLFTAYKIVDLEKHDVFGKAFDRTQILSYIPFTYMFDNAEDLAEWIGKFYSDLPYEYLSASESHTTSKSNVEKRLSIIRKSIHEFLNIAE